MLVAHLEHLMSRPNEPRGIIIPFPIEAIRRMPPPAFVTQTPHGGARTHAARGYRGSGLTPRARIVIAGLALSALVLAVLAGFVLVGVARHGAPSAAMRAFRTTGERRGGGGPAADMRSSVPGSVNLLIAGLDADDGARNEPGTRSDAIMLLHLDADRGGAWLVSIPRDTWVSLPGHGERRIDAAYALGGPALLVETLERFTRLRIDHLAVIDRTGVRRLTDGVGGVDVALDAPAPGVADAGRGALALEMSGAMAMDFVNGRDPATSGDAVHIHREHLYLRALLAQLRDRGTLADPPALQDLASALGSSVRVDPGLTPAAFRSLLDSAKPIPLEDVTFLTAPVSRPDTPGESSVVAPDLAGCAQLWDALAHDEMAAFVDAHPELVSAR
jgi:LCP family protein required for cell wall assembly